MPGAVIRNDAPLPQFKSSLSRLGSGLQPRTTERSLCSFIPPTVTMECVSEVIVLKEPYFHDLIMKSPETMSLETPKAFTSLQAQECGRGAIRLEDEGRR